MEVNITQKMEWLTKRCDLSQTEQEYIELMLKETALEVARNFQTKTKDIDLSRKFNYKVRNKETGSFASTGRSKATWQRASAVLDILKGKTGYNNINANNVDNWEVVLFPLEDSLTMSSADFLEYYKDAENEKIRKRQQKELERQEKIKQYQIEKELEVLRALKQKYPNA
jgi:hypothetical protein